MRETLRITGMTCAACSARIEKIVGRMDGVINCVVNLTTERMAVEFDHEKTGLDSIKKRIEKTGYGWAEIKKDTVDEYNLRKEREIKVLRKKFIVAAVFTVLLVYLSMEPMIAELFGLHYPIPKILHYDYYPIRFTLAQLVLSLPVIIAGYRFYYVGFRAIRLKSPNMDSLIALGTSAAMFYSLYNSILIVMGDPVHVTTCLYYESATVIITLVLLGKMLEAISKGKTSEAIKKLMGLRPKTAIVIRDGREIETLIDSVTVGDIVLVKPGSKIPVDGVVVEGITAIDEAMLTGESMPIDKKIGDKVYAASINKYGFIKFKAEKVGSDTALAQIIKLVEDAQCNKAPIAKMADVISGFFVQIVVVIAVIAAIGWFIVERNVAFSLQTLITVLVIACPCALGLATPTAIMVGTGKGAENGILLKGGEALEITHKIKTIVFDKTGTITEGKPVVTDIIPLVDIESKRLLQFAGSAEKGSEHPLGEAIVKALELENIEFLPVSGFEAISGKGIHCVINEQEILVGNKKLMEEYDILSFELYDEVDRIASEGKTPMYVAIDQKIAGIIAVADVVKASSANAIKKLSEMDIEVVMITGDNKRTAEAIARQVGIKRVLSEVLPQNKALEVKKLQESGDTVAMVGDGINDAPALALADIGIAIGSGTDVAMESADIVLMHSDLMDVPATIRLSKVTIRNIKQNLFWAFCYNAAGISLAAGVLYIFGGPLLTPTFAAASMTLSSLSVLTNALRLKRFKVTG